MNYLIYLSTICIFVYGNEVSGNINESNNDLKNEVENDTDISKDTPIIEDLKEEEQNLENEDLEDFESIRLKTTKIIVGLEYLGVGYDIVKANTLGDSEQGEDLGYRAPVIEFAWAQTDVGVTNSLKSLQPVGGWVRPKVSCGESENVKEINSISEFKDLTQVDVGVDIEIPNVGTGSLNTQYENIKNDKENKKNKLYTNTYYCFTYAAGIPPTLDWSTWEEFKISVSELPKNIIDYEECDFQGYKNRKEVCKDIRKWIDFFMEFGTHVVTEIHIGGKLTRYLSVPSEMVEGLSKKGYDIKAVAGAVISGVSGKVSLGVSENDEKEIQNVKRASKLKFTVLGGIHPDKNITEASIRKWKSTVPKYPMPIKIEVENITTFLPRSYYTAFKEAFNFYVGLNKGLPWDIEQKDGRIMTLKSVLANSKQVMETNENNETPMAKCPVGKRVIFGFIILIDKELKTTVKPCLQNRKNCTIEDSKDKNKVLIYIICGNSLGLEFHLKYKNEEDENKELKCDEGEEIVTGFIMDIKNNKLTSCKTGEESCKYENSGSMIIVCTDKRLPELKMVETTTNISKDGKVEIGGDKHTLIGFVACIEELVKVYLCQPFSSGCKISSNEDCKYSMGWGIFVN